MKQIHVLVAAAVLAASVPAYAQAPAPAGTYPARPVRFILGFQTGGVSDIVGRVVAQKWTETLGQTVLVENRPGAGGSIATDYVAKSPPDGYTILLTSPTQLAIVPNLMKAVTYDPLKDVAAIGGIAWTPNILSVNASSQIRTLADLVNAAKAAPGKLTFGSSGMGSVGHMSGEMLRVTTGAELLHIPYKSAGAAYPDMFSGSVTMVFDTLPSAIQHIQSGKARPIALMSDKRSSLVPDVPTFAEAGFPKSTLRFWIGVHGPVGMPPAVVQKLSESLAKAIESPELKQRFLTLGADPFPSTPQEMANVTRASYEEITSTIKAAGIKPE